MFKLFAPRKDVCVRVCCIFKIAFRLMFDALQINWNAFWDFLISSFLIYFWYLLSACCAQVDFIFVMLSRLLHMTSLWYSRTILHTSFSMVLFFPFIFWHFCTLRMRNATVTSCYNVSTPFIPNLVQQNSMYKLLATWSRQTFITFTIAFT